MVRHHPYTRREQCNTGNLPLITKQPTSVELHKQSFNDSRPFRSVPASWYSRTYTSKRLQVSQYMGARHVVSPCATEKLGVRRLDHLAPSNANLVRRMVGPGRRRPPFRRQSDLTLVIYRTGPHTLNDNDDRAAFKGAAAAAGLLLGGTDRLWGTTWSMQ